MDKSSELMARARLATSLDDFGEESFREGLDMVVRSADAEADLNEAGKAALDIQIIAMLTRRLKVEQSYRQHPEIDEQEITAPVIGLGLPRTGSTVLSFLLAADPATRYLRLWESDSPAPPPEAATQDSDPRIAQTEEGLRLINQTFPRLAAMVPCTPTGPIECQTLMGLDFKSQVFQCSYWMPTYVDWLNHQADMVSTYRYVKRVLKLLQWRCPPRRWRLKNPAHSLFITALDEVFPDARFWMTHRDVASVVPSVADLYFELQRPFTDQVDMEGLGRMTADFCKLGMERMIAFRDAGNDNRFFDIHFASFHKDPLHDVEGLYGFLGEPFTDVARSSMETWLQVNAENRLVAERTPPDAFGIDIPRLRERFRFYTDRFNAPAGAPLPS